MAEKDTENKMLESYFQAANEVAPEPSGRLMSRVLEDALAAQPASEALRSAPVVGGLWRDFLRAVGGWPAMAGLVSATVAGLWLGIAPPAALPGATIAYLGLDDASYPVDAAPGLGFDLSEEAL
ncbi:hypothetical protein AAFO92_12180 [Roseovarius sp. CAU 1744]|uniref:hypothetical protein n=1 Tax=Roseovarius sp. CAU 1744 TaxID=3140368 RepID=UPI00325C13B6